LTKRRTILAVMSDKHSGSKLGLMNPNTILHDESEDGTTVEYSPTPTATQKWLWECFIQDRDGVRDLAGDDEILLIDNGDLTQGKKYPRSLVSTRDADQMIMAVDCFRPWLELPNLAHIRLSAGTGAHNWEENTAEILVAKMLQGEFQTRDISFTRHGMMTYNGAVIDYAHHGPHPGSRDWLRGNVALFYLRDLLYRAERAGVALPALVLRAHFHQRVKVMLDWCGKTVTLMITPSYCGLDDYAMQAVRSPDTIGCGCYAAEIVDGRIVDIHEFIHTVRLTAGETL
jgi:hypothetical protein